VVIHLYVVHRAKITLGPVEGASCFVAGYSELNLRGYKLGIIGLKVFGLCE
jgi:hypothetical protein